MAAVLISMKRAMMRHEQRPFWTWKLFVGLILAAITISLGWTQDQDPEVTAGTLALIVAVWTLGWLLAPMQSGGSGEDMLLPEHFALLPIRPQALARGLLAAAMVGPGPLVTFLALLVLGIFAVQLGIVPALVAIPAIALTMLFIVVLSRLMIGILNVTLRSRIGLEFAALQFAMIISLSISGWILPAAFTETSMAEGPGALIGPDRPEMMSTIAFALPTGWGSWAILAADEGNWPGVVAALLGLGVLVLLMMQVWSVMLQRRLTTRPSSSSDHALVRPTRGLTLLPQTALGASIGKELRAWFREPRYALELRVSIYTGLLIVVIPAFAGYTQGLPFAGAAILFIAVVSASNSYGLDGTAFWVPWLAPRGTALDVRGKQLGFLMLFEPIAIVSTIALTAVTGQHWAWPWVAAIVPALLGAAAGVAILTSVLGAAPVPAEARRSGNLMASADNFGSAYLAMISASLIGALPGLAVWAGWDQGNTILLWLGAPAGIFIGVATAVGGGLLAVRRLTATGPELLDLMKNPRRVGADGEESWSGLGSIRASFVSAEKGLPGVVATICWWTFWIPLGPVGVAALVLKLNDGDYLPWMLTDHVEASWEWPAIILPIVLGVGLLLVGITIERRSSSNSGSGDKESKNTAATA